MWRRFCKQIILVWCHRLSLSSLTRSLIWNTTFWTFHNRNIHNFYVLCKLSARSLRQMLCCSHIKIWNLANHMKKWNKEHQTLSFQFFIKRSSILMFFVSFFMWFARFQILICEPQSIWRKVLVLSYFYYCQTKGEMKTSVMI